MALWFEIVIKEVLIYFWSKIVFSLDPYKAIIFQNYGDIHGELLAA